MTAAEHAGHTAAGAPAGRGSAGAERQRQQGASHGQTHAAATLPADRATGKLLTLVGALVRDSVVQEEIRRDPALREGWSDPGVRRIVTGQQ